MTQTAYLVLQDGTTLQGRALGHRGGALGEAACVTRMAGLAEGLADPRCAGQILIHTFPMLGNYGLPGELKTLPFAPAAVVARELCDKPSHHRSAGTLDDALRERGICALTGVDTRFLMRHLMKTGPMNAMITMDKPTVDEALLAGIRGHRAKVALGSGVIRLDGAKGPVAVIDYGAGQSVAEMVRAKGFAVTIIPAGMDDPDIGAAQGIILSDGAGDPAAMPLLPQGMLDKNRPILALGMGALVLALARGGSVGRMHRPHRGANQPVRDLKRRRVIITSQYHGYEVTAPPEGAELTYANLHGGSVEGLVYPDIRAVAVHFDVQAQDGPHDTGYIIGDFIHSMGVRTCR